MADVKEIQRELQAPFADQDIEWRAQQSGVNGNKYWAILLAYVNNRAIQERLDNVVGVDKWRNSYEKAPDGGVMCGLSLKFDEWITKFDGAENTAMEAVKGGLSGAMKRAAVQWGIGRYLYNLDTTIVSLYETKQNDTDLLINVKVKQEGREVRKRMYCKRPKLPDWALPSEPKEPTAEQLSQIRTLLVAKRKPDNLIDAELKTITSYRLAEDKITKLKLEPRVEPL